MEYNIFCGSQNTVTVFPKEGYVVSFGLETHCVFLLGGNWTFNVYYLDQLHAENQARTKEGGGALGRSPPK